MFRGISAINLDAKGRMAIPSRHRLHLEKAAQSQLVVTIDTEQRCLLLYALKEWETIEAKITALPSFNAEVRRIQRILIGHANELELDNNGRVLLPPLLREYAELNKTVMLVGQGNKFEIWSEDNWRSGRESWLTRTTPEEKLPTELQQLSL